MDFCAYESAKKIASWRYSTRWKHGHYSGRIVKPSAKFWWLRRNWKRKSGAHAAVSKPMSKKQETTGWVLIAGLGALLIWLLSKAGQSFLHEGVSSIITPYGTIKSDPQTGYPQFDAGDPSTYDAAKYAAAVPPIDTNGNVTQFPSDIFNCTCPSGYQKWRGKVDGSVWCFPS